MGGLTTGKFKVSKGMEVLKPDILLGYQQDRTYLGGIYQLNQRVGFGLKEPELNKLYLIHKTCSV